MKSSSLSRAAAALFVVAGLGLAACSGEDVAAEFDIAPAEPTLPADDAVSDDELVMVDEDSPETNEPEGGDGDGDEGSDDVDDAVSLPVDSRGGAN